jgi:hypothetical protein
MRKLLIIGGAAVTGLWAMAASANEATGTISNIDLVRNTFVVQGIYFAASPNNTIGEKLSKLKEGDRVTVDYADDWANQMGPVNAMILKKTD